MPSRIKRLFRAKLVCFALLVLVLLLAGMVYEQWGRSKDRKRLAQVGRSVDIGGRNLNMYCSGEGAPTVILISGNAMPGYSWSKIQPEIAKYTRACWFDRAGEGWSDPGPFPRSSMATAQDLHLLLERADVPPPYILVGHSLGGLDARIFNGLYANEVAGAVLVDAAHEDEPKRAPAFMLGRSAPRYMWHPLHAIFSAAANAGVIRLTTPSSPLPETASQRTLEQVIAALQTRPQAIASFSSGGVVSADSYAQAHAAGGFGDRPLIVLTRGKAASHAPQDEMEKQANDYEQVWMHELQPQLARLSTRGRQVIVTNSGHRIPEEAPEAILGAVREVVTLSRENPSK